MNNRLLEIMVGVFIVIAAIALSVLALKVSGLTHLSAGRYYRVYAEFDNIGDLKVRAPVRLAGVTIGQVQSILLDPKTFRAKVELLINEKENNLPIDTSARILTAGLLGSNYIGLSPGFEEKTLKDNGMIENTNPAIILENLIGQLLFHLKSK